MITGIVFDIRRYSIHDGPGIRTAVFFKGCPLACRWCHNPEGRSFKPELILRSKRCILCDDCLGVCPNQAVTRKNDMIQIDRRRCMLSGECAKACIPQALQVVGRAISIEEALGEIERDQVFYEQSGGGVTFTGGEPFAQPNYLFELVTACRERGIHAAVDTCGYAPWPVIKPFLPLVDTFLYDLKLMDEERHREWTGVSNLDILSNLGRLAEAGKDLVVRIPVIPSVNDDPENLRTAGAFLASLAHKPAVELLSYHDIAAGKYEGLGIKYEMDGILPPARERLDEISTLLSAYGLQVKA
jgi:pyruvate formate lyase activating enzyme